LGQTYAFTGTGKKKTAFIKSRLPRQISNDGIRMSR
jgi:hypothetical protein